MGSASAVSAKAMARSRGAPEDDGVRRVLHQLAHEHARVGVEVVGIYRSGPMSLPFHSTIVRSVLP